MLKRIIIASVGFNWSRTLRGIYGVGLYPSDIVILINSKPEKEDAIMAMNILRDRLNEVGVEALELWLNPLEPFETNIARVRSLVESRAPCNVVILIAGGFRWITTALIMSAIVLNIIGNLMDGNKIVVEKIRIEIEEEIEGVSISDSKPLYMEIHYMPKLVNLSAEDYELLRIIGGNQVNSQTPETSAMKIKDIVKRSRKPRTTIVRKLMKLEKMGLLTHEARGRGYVYKLTSIGKMLSINVS